MKVAIVENEIFHTENLQNLLQQWSQDHWTMIGVETFQNGEDFLNSCVDTFDLVFMDIQMEGIDGMATAHKLRDKEFKGQIVFLTAYSEYVFEGYEVQALNYLMKPVSYEKIAKCIDYVAHKLNDDHYNFRDHDAVKQIAYSKILYFNSANHYTQIITTEGTFRQRETLQSVFAHLPKRFLFCHRTIIVNMEHVAKLKGHSLVLSNNETVPISRTYLQEIRSALLSYADSMR